MTDPVPAVLVSDAEFARTFNARNALHARARVVGSDARAVARVTRTVVAHDRTRAVGRNLAYIPGGAWVVWCRWRESHTNARYERMIRAAEATANWEQVLEWEARAELARERRHKRVMNWITAPKELVKAFAMLLFVLVGLLLALGGMVAWVSDGAVSALGPIRVAAAAIAWIVWLIAIGGTQILLGLPCVVVLGLWWVGRRAEAAPAFLAPATERVAARDLIPDEGAILAALQDLGIPKYREKLKEGWQPRWPLPTVLDGKGYRTQLELPRGVNVEMINKKKALLAHNLVRLPVEVWPTEPQNQPGVLDLWVAHQGLLSGPVPPYPLLTEGVCDYFKGVPVGFDQRGDVANARLMASNYAIGGTMGSGKSSLVINLVTGAALDPLVDIDVYLMAYNVDYDPFKERLSTLVKGDEDGHITAAMDGLRDLREEVTKRGKLLDEMGGIETKVTRALAKKDSRLRPRLVVFDECQELYRHDKYGEQAKQLAIKVMTKARKCAITLVWVTPEPSADSLPRELAKIVSHGVCFAINDYQGNDAILGTGSYKRGISAVDLDPHQNIGTAMAFGFGARPGLLRSCYIRKDATTDELTPIAQRSLGPWRGALPAEPDEVRDILQDVHEAFGSKDKVKATDMVSLLRELAPNCRAYRSLNGTQLGALLGSEGVSVTDFNGVLTVRADRVLRALDMRQGVE